MMAAPPHSFEAGGPARQPALPEDLRWATGSTLLALFTAALLDQAALPEISSALEKTGRFRNDPFARAARTVASQQIIAWGDGEDRRAEGERLKSLHRVVRGATKDGQPYSAFTPDLWKFVQASAILMTRNSAAVLTGRDLSPQEEQALYDYLLADIGVPLQLGPSTELPTDWGDFLAWYEQMTERLAPTQTLHDALGHLRRTSAPDLLPAPLRPIWPLARPVLGRVILVLGTGALHPKARAAMQVKWGRAEKAQFTLLSHGVRIAYRHLPKRVTMSPLAYNRWQYERLINQYRSLALESFAPDAAAGRR